MNNGIQKSIRISGRYTYVEDVLYLGYSGCFVEFMTDSADIGIKLITDTVLQESGLLGRVAVYVDDNDVPAVDTMLDKTETDIRIALQPGTGTDSDAPATMALFHKIRIEKMSEAAFGLVGIQEIDIQEGAVVHPTDAPARRIEFIGDSITCGYGNEAANELEVFTTSQENPEKAYAIRTAKALDAEYHLVSWSGIGIITNWVPEDVNEPLEEILMPQLYPYTDLRLSERLDITAQRWDYNRFVPDLIVINLGTNDDSYTRCIQDRVDHFGGKYGLFLDQVHDANPDSAILCILGIMGQNLCEEEARQVELFRARHPEVRIEFLKMPEQDKEIDGMGADFHPSQSTHIKSSDLLTDYIKKYMNW